MAKELRSSDGKYNLVGRYNQILIDGSPLLANAVLKEFKVDENVLRIQHFKIKDFYSYAQ